MNISCYIIDDEQSCIDCLIRYVQKMPFLSLKGYSTDPFEALEYINEHPIDFIFVDISMDQLSGLELIQMISNKVVFTTAHTKYAVPALSYINTVDYLVKPLTFERFIVAIKKIEELFKNPVAKVELPKNDFKNSFPVKTALGTEYLDYHKIDYIKAGGYYSTVFYDGRKAVVPMSLNDIEALFPKELFVRVHRSYIVQKSKIIKRTYEQLLLQDNTHIPLGRSYRSVLSS